MARSRLFLPGLLLVALVACGSAATTSNQSLADPTLTVAPRGSAAPTAGVSAPATPGAPATATITAVPRASSAAAATATAPPASTPTQATTGVLPQPNGTIPAGWNVFRGPREFPFAIAYPPNWTVDQSLYPEQQIIYFVGPSGNTDEESVAIISGARQTDANIDVLLDDFYQQKSAYCDREGVEFTEYRQITDATFAILGAACDQGGVLFFLQVGAGLKGGDQWDIEMRTTYERKEEFRRGIFDPMLASLNVYAPMP